MYKAHRPTFGFASYKSKENANNLTHETSKALALRWQVTFVPLEDVIYFFYIKKDLLLNNIRFKGSSKWLPKGIQIYITILISLLRKKAAYEDAYF